jgi:hypothetical protein
MYEISYAASSFVALRERVFEDPVSRFHCGRSSAVVSTFASR